MHVALIGAEIEENLGLRYIAAALRRAGHRATIVPFDHGRQIPQVAEQIARGTFDVAGLSMMFQLRSREFCALIERIRAAGFPGVLVAGGQYATFMAREILAGNPGLDAIVLGDGELPMTELCDAVASADGRAALGTVHGLVLRTDDGAVVATSEREGRTDLTTLAAPVRDGDARRHLGMPSAPMVSSRGCYADCSFCSIVAWEKLSGGPKLRLRPPGHVADEMAALYHERGVRVFNFHDDNFWLPTVKANRTRLDELDRALRQRNVGDIALLLKCRPNDTDPALFSQAKSMGLVRVYVGIESDAPNGLITLRRGVSQSQNQRALDLMREIDVHACSNLLLFDPDTRLGDVPFNIGFYEKNAHHTLNFCRTEPYGGTPLTRRLVAEGRLTGDYLGFDYAMRDPRVELLWRIVHLAFHDRNFPAEGLANSVIGLGYRFHLAKRFWPGAAAEALRERVYDFIVRFGRSQARFLQTALAFARTCDLADHAIATMFAVDLARAIREEDAQNTLECDALVRAVEAFAASRGAGGSDGRLGEGAAGSGWFHVRGAAVLTATLAAGAAACHPHEASAGPHDAGTTAPHGHHATADAGVVAPGDGHAGTVVAHVALSAGPSSSFGPGTESGRHHSLYAQATLEGAGSEGFEFDHADVDPNVATVDDVYITSTGRGAHFLVSLPAAPRAETAASVRAFFRSRTGGAPLVTTSAVRVYPDRRISIGAQSVPASPEYMVCDPAPAPQLTAFNTDRMVHLGVESYGTAHSVSGLFQPVSFVTWLDAAVHGTPDALPTVTTDGGQVQVTGYTGWRAPAGSSAAATIRFDPRNADGRLAAGTRTITVTWHVTQGARRQDFTATTRAVIGDDGTVTVGTDARPQVHGAAGDTAPALPLERRFGARIVAQPDAHDRAALVLSIESAVTDDTDDAAFLWRATAGDLVHTAHSKRAVWTPPRDRGRHLVTCAVQTGRAELAIASFSYDVG